MSLLMTMWLTMFFSGFDLVGNTPRELIGGGEHFDDTSRTVRRGQAAPSSQLPKVRLHASVVNQGLYRPRIVN